MWWWCIGSSVSYLFGRDLLAGFAPEMFLGGRLDVAHQVASDGIGHEEALPFQSPPLADGDGFNQTPLVEVVGEASTDAEKLGDAVVVEEFRLRGGIREPRCCGGCVLLHGRTISRLRMLLKSLLYNT